MTAGRRPRLLAGTLAALREVADEIVVAVEEERAEEVAAALQGIADVVRVFPATAPADRPLAWAFAGCSGKWIFNIDDDEVASPRLVRELPGLVRRTDITHAWIARRWLHPTVDTFVASRPWGNEFQLRLVLADERFTRFSDVFHRPITCVGPSTYVGAPLWHLDTALNPAARRRFKASVYEAERPGMRVEGLAHNLGLYVPELEPGLELLAVPAADRAAIEAALAYVAGGGDMPRIVRATNGDVDEHWVGPPHSESLYAAELRLEAEPTSMKASTQHTVDVQVSNCGNVTWRWGADGRPTIRLGYRWLRDGKEVHEPHALRTTLPVDVPPNATELVPVHVVAPAEPGRYELELDLVHEDVRPFGCAVTTEVEVAARERIVLIGRPERVPEVVAELDLPPQTEPLVLLRDPGDHRAYGDYRSVEGLRGYLLHATEGSGRAATVPRLVARTLRLALRSRRSVRGPRFPELSPGETADSLVVGGPNWAPDGAFVREWWVVAATALLWRLGGRPVVIPDHALPDGAGVRGRAVRWTLRRLRTGTGR